MFFFLFSIHCLPFVCYHKVAELKDSFSANRHVHYNSTILIRSIKVLSTLLLTNIFKKKKLVPIHMAAEFSFFFFFYLSADRDIYFCKELCWLLVWILLVDREDDIKPWWSWFYSMVFSLFFSILCFWFFFMRCCF